MDLIMLFQFVVAAKRQCVWDQPQNVQHHTPHFNSHHHGISENFSKQPAEQFNGACVSMNLITGGYYIIVTLLFAVLYTVFFFYKLACRLIP